VNRCPRPIDPIDVEALAAGAEPVSAGDARAHARECPSCRDRVEKAVRFAASLEIPGGETIEPDLAARIVRLRAFSRHEKRDSRLWRSSAGLAIALFLAGLALVALPVLTGREQAGLALGAMAPALALLRSLVRSVAVAVSTAPGALGALSESVRGQSSLGLLALVLLAPAVFGLKWALARVRR